MGNLKKDSSVKGWNSHWGAVDTIKSLEGINTAHPEVVRFLLSLTDRSSRCIEIGCGSGTYSVELLAQKRNVLATDFSDKSLALTKLKAKRLYNLDIATEIVDAYRIPYGDDSFDLVFSDGVIEHLDIPRAMNEMWRVTKKNGWVVMKVPSGSWLYKVVYYYLSPSQHRPCEAWLSKREWSDLIVKSGLKNVSVRTCGSIFNGIFTRVSRTQRVLSFSVPFGHIHYLISGQKI